MGRKKIGDLETTMQAVGMPAVLGELHRPSPPATATDTPSPDELLALAERLETDVWGTKTRTAQRYLDDAADALRRLAAKPADNGVREATIEECVKIAEWELGDRRSRPRVVAALRALATKAKL